MDRDKSIQEFVTGRLHNPNRAAEGPILPPPNRGGFRVPIVSNLRAVRTQRYSGGTQFTLVWTDPEEFRNQIDHFNVYAIGIYDDDVTPQGPWQSPASPCEIQVDANSARRMILVVQTELKSGLKSPLEVSPSVGVTSLTPSVATGTIVPDESIPLSGLGPWGTLNYILAGNGSSAAPTWKSRGTLDLVEGRSTLLVSGIPVLSNGSGQLREVDTTSIDDTDSPYTQLATDWTILCDASAGAIEVDLLTAAGRDGAEVTIVKIDSSANAVTLDPNGAETIQGDTDGQLTAEGESWTIQADGSNWRIV